MIVCRAPRNAAPLARKCRRTTGFRNGWIDGVPFIGLYT
ncbi:hypothetical protein [Azospirillum doebereinerae]